VVHLESVFPHIRPQWQGSHASRLALRARRKGRAQHRPLAAGAAGAVGCASARRTAASLGVSLKCTRDQRRSDPGRFDPRWLQNDRRGARSAAGSM